jgi:hypothetical protein
VGGYVIVRSYSMTSQQGRLVVIRQKAAAALLGQGWKGISIKSLVNDVEACGVHVCWPPNCRLTHPLPQHPVSHPWTGHKR